jgi:hypothetical protein
MAIEVCFNDLNVIGRRVYSYNEYKESNGVFFHFV